MLPLKERIPSIEALEVELEKQWGHVKKTIATELAAERADVLNKQKLLINSLVSFFGYALVSLIGLSAFMPAIAVNVIGFILLVWLGVMFIRWLLASREYSQKINRKMFSVVMRVLTLRAQHVDKQSDNWQSQQEQVIGKLHASELLTERVDSLSIGDIVTGTFLSKSVMLSELHATRTEGSSKHRRTVEVFKGIFVTAALPKTFTGVTFISTEGDETGYGHRDFWSRVTGQTAVEETELEWNEFEKKLHVASSDGSEARYILTPDFMQQLFGWWKEKQQNIRLVFRDSSLYVLFPDANVSLSSVITNTNSDDALQAYALTILKPFWHLLILLEEVRERFE